MDNTILAALIGIVGIIIGAILNSLLPGSKFANWLAGKSRNHTLIGTWDSIWGPLPNGPTKYQELMVITKQSGQRIKGFINKGNEPEKKWEIEGRYDGHFLMIIYYPAKDAKNSDFLDYGCYFFQRKADGSFEGYSTGFGSYEDIIGEGVTTDFHILRRV